MKLLIVSITAGEGHNAIGHALESFIAENYNNCEVKMIDLYQKEHRFAAFLVDNMQSFMMKFFPRIMHLNYRMTMNKKLNTSHNFPLKMGLIAMDSFLDEVKAFQPDIIFATHAYAAALVSYCAANKFIYCKNYTVIPDYVAYPYCENNAALDYIFVSDDEVKNELVSRGIGEEKIRVYGIPCQTKFLEPHNRPRLLRQCHIDTSKLTVLIMNGGKNMGAHSNLQILKSIYRCENVNIIVVNGRNEKTKNAIDRYLMNHPNPNVTNIGFASNIDELMSISDVMIGKAGGVSLTEAFAMDLPIIVPFSPPYQELWSMRKLEEMGIITHLKTAKDIPDYLEHLVSFPDELMLMKRNMQKIRRTDATERIVDLMMRNI